MSVDLQTCPGCSRRFDAPLTRARPCPFCRARLVIIRDENRTPIELLTSRDREQRRYGEFRALKLQRLWDLKNSGVTEVTLGSGGGKSFPECYDDDGKILTIDEAIKTQPLPHRVATDDGKMRCCCLYRADLNDGFFPETNMSNESDRKVIEEALKNDEKRRSVNALAIGFTIGCIIAGTVWWYGGGTTFVVTGFVIGLVFGTNGAKK